MAFVSLIEYASGEFAGYEFAREEGALLVATDFSAAGNGQALLVGGSKANTTLSIAGQSVNVFQTQTSSSSVLEAQSAAGSVFETIAVVGTNFEANTSVLMQLYSGIKISTTAAMEGKADVLFLSLDGFGFDIKSGTAVNFFSSAFINSDLIADATSSAAFYGQAKANSALIAAGSSLFTLRNDMLFSFNLSATGRAAAAFQMNTVKNSRFNSDGVASYALKANAVIGTSFAAAGSGLFVPQGYVVANAQGVFVGTTICEFSGQQAIYGMFEIAGKAGVLMNPGNPVFAYLPPAYDVVIRPYENRTVIRRKESRETEWK